MDREGKCGMDDETTKEETEALETIRLETGEMDLIPGSPKPLCGSSSPKNPSQ